MENKVDLEQPDREVVAKLYVRYSPKLTEFLNSLVVEMEVAGVGTPEVANVILNLTQQTAADAVHQILGKVYDPDAIIALAGQRFSDLVAGRFGKITLPKYNEDCLALKLKALDPVVG